MSAGERTTTDQRVGASAPGPDQAPSVAELVSQLGDDVTALFHQEVELAKAEVKQEVARAARAGALLGAGAVAGLVTLFLLAWTVAWGLSAALPTWLAFLVTTIVFGAIAGVSAALGKRRMGAVELAPQRTIETLDQDKQTVRERMSS